MGMMKEIAAVFGVAALVGLGGAGAVYNAIDAPERDHFTVQAAGAPSATIDDPQDVLTPEDEQRLQRDTANINAADVVTDFHYMVFKTNHENILDDVEELLRSQYPELIDQSKGENGRPADGVLIVGVGLDPRQAFIYGGDDVTQELMLDDDSYRESLLDPMKTGVKEGNIPSGLFRTANLAMDADGLSDRKFDRAENDRGGAIVGAGMGGFGAATAVGAGVVAVRSNRRKAIAKAREDYELVTHEYTRLAGRLDEVDVRANSLSSAFADETLRRQWAEVRDRFLGMNELVHGAQGLSSINMDDDKDVYLSLIHI